MTSSQVPARAAGQPLSPALDKTFKIGIVLKGLDGVLEIAGGMLLLFLSPQAIEHLIRALTAHELSEDPHDFIATHLLHSAGHLTASATLFGAIYLLSHGVAKVVLVALVLRDRPAARVHRLPALPDHRGALLRRPDRADCVRHRAGVADLARVPEQASAATPPGRYHPACLTCDVPVGMPCAATRRRGPIGPAAALTPAARVPRCGA